MENLVCNPVAKPVPQFGQIKLSLFISFEIDSLYTVYKHRKICICMTKCRAGFTTEVIFVYQHVNVR